MLAMKTQTFAEIANEPLVKGLAMPHRIESPKGQIAIQANKILSSMSHIGILVSETEQILNREKDMRLP